MDDSTSDMRRAPRDGLTALILQIKQIRRDIRALQGGAPLRQAGIRAGSGFISSLDYDGTSPTDLGTRGWMLGSWDRTTSILVLNGRDIISDLEAKDAQILDLLATQVATDGGSTGLAFSSIGATWGTYTTRAFTAPTWATHVVITGIGVVQAQDTITGGLAFLDARVALGIGSAGLTISDAITLPVTVGASVALSSGTPAHTATIPIVGGATVTCGVQLRASHPTAYTSASVSIAATVTFTR